MSILLRIKNLKLASLRSFSEHVAKQLDVEKHALKTASAWKWGSLFVAFPTIGFLAYKNLIVGEEHPHDKEYVPYDHLRIRKKPFPWGEESLFHSKHNPTPNPATDEHQEEEPKENVITAFIRRKQKEHCENDWKIQMNAVRDNHQKMLEHIERKKFPHLPPLPRYSRLFSYPRYDLQDPKVRLPGGFDD